MDSGAVFSGRLGTIWSAEHEMVDGLAYFAAGATFGSTGPVAGARLAAAALAAQSAEQASELERVLHGFDGALAHLHRVGGAAEGARPDQHKE